MNIKYLGLVYKLFCDLTFLSLLFFLYIFVASGDGWVLELVRVLACGKHTQVISQLLLLQVSLGEVLKLPLWELNVRWGSDSELGTVTRDGNSGVSEGSSLSINLDAILKVFLEGSNIQYLVLDGSGTVNDEFNSSLLCLNLCGKSPDQKVQVELIHLREEKHFVAGKAPC